MSDVLGPIAASYGIVMALSPLLQVRRMLVRGSSDDISISYLAVLEVGFALWVGYGISLWNGALIVPNSVAFLIGLGTIAVALRFRTGRHQQTQPA